MEYVNGEKLSKTTNGLDISIVEAEIMRAANVYVNFLRNEGSKVSLDIGRINRTKLLNDFGLGHILHVKDERKIVFIDVGDLSRAIFLNSSV